ncbi:2'-5' RNA ligase family protein [Candidatus Mycolicibacterium alkanivorans]|uniref:2'-5' RNA ligase family protein n=1 Tax=Candidatus Mycolicibacterium alkanivorans TaxID=2954114 RepID=A0ABS9YXT6_9MYCO|nr:2'-5' RNA ligase family protein [Candidatus Mycolicibacterium alkanivorans]MCI4676020.1 2'-5' RNA ligase family protein [Candidatus Mycolicibacterium alkanivorans]
MAHSIELLLDGHGDAAIRTVWHRLVDAGLPSQLRVRSATNRPHITLLAADRIEPAVDDELAPLRQRFPLPVVVGAPLIFGGGRLTLARLIVASVDLLDLHREVYRRCLPHTTQEPFAHSAPGHWTPHATLGRQFTPEQVGEALAVIDELSGDIGANVVGLRRWDGDSGREFPII